jgi:cytochrome c biogenesis protein CcmG, thiol:disulfide interchange protein DsbE
MIRIYTTLVGFSALIAGIALAQPQPAASQPVPLSPSSQPKVVQPQSPSEGGKPEVKTGAKPDAGTSGAGYPPIVQKQLWASVDYRGKKAPEIEAEEWLSTKPDWKGKTLLVDLWATWCPPCRRLIPELETWQTKFKDDLVIVGITDEPAATVTKFMDQRGGPVNYAMARDSKKRTNTAIGIQGIPHVLIISSDGVVRWQGYPLSDEEPLTEAKIKQIIDADKAVRATTAPKAEAKPAEKTAESPKPSGK